MRERGREREAGEADAWGPRGGERKEVGWLGWAQEDGGPGRKGRNGLGEMDFGPKENLQIYFILDFQKFQKIKRAFRK